MNSPSIRSILPRAATIAIERAMKTNPVVALLGARQSGKTTLLRSLPDF
jgi:ABC-type phosphate/phosphonate transport system ATPase subunit